jgi:hypothetical protein
VLFLNTLHWSAQYDGIFDAAEGRTHHLAGPCRLQRVLRGRIVFTAKGDGYTGKRGLRPPA